MKISLSNGLFSKRPLEENFSSVKKLGFDNIEFNMKSVEVENDVSVYEAKRLADKYGVVCSSLHAATVNVTDEIEIHRAIYYGKISVDFARILSAPLMVIHSNVSRRIPAEKRQEILKKVFQEVRSYACNQGIKLALENLSYASTGYGKNVNELQEIFGIIDDGTIGLTLDFCHSTAAGTTSSLLERYHDRLCNIHMSNRTHKAFHEENANLASLLPKLKSFNYDGLITLELSRKCKEEDILKTKSVLEGALKKNGFDLEK
jgi:sugar phosphate isomerase/epimerase